MSRRGYFIAGTDTGVGKTRVSCALLQALNASGRRAIGMKPVATGAARIDGRLVSEDATLLDACSAPFADLSGASPRIFEPPVSPDIAAEMAGISVDPEAIVRNFDCLASQADLVIVEGTGGWLCPIGPRASMADVAVALGLPVILVVGLKLGCISHAQLTAESIRSHGGTFAGWIGSRVDPGYLLPEANLATLARRLDAPPLALLEYAPQAAPTPDHAFLELARRL